jgi:hypothetical protein
VLSFASNAYGSEQNFCAACTCAAAAAANCAGLKKKLKDLMGEFSEMRARIHEENRQVVQRRVYTVTGQHLPEEDIDTMIETGELDCSRADWLVAAPVVICWSSAWCLFVM